MQSEQQFFPQKPVFPLADQLAGGFIHNAPVAPFFDGPELPPAQKHTIPFYGFDFQPSEACPKNFIIFDQAAKQSQIVFHPVVGPNFCYTGFNASSQFFEDSARENVVSDGREVSYLKEDSDDINVLLSFDEEEEEDSDEEVSTARTDGISEEFSTAMTDGNYGGDSPESCSSHGSRTKKGRLSSFSHKSTCSGSNSSARKREKMRKMVKALRRIVPGGNQMNTAAVIDEAVRYLKSLKVEVQKLGVGNFKT